MTEPRADRPHVPGYGVPDTLRGILDWAWARERLESAITYWIATADAEATPHMIPIWGAWVDDRWYVEGGPTRWQRNLRANPKLAVKVESGKEVVIVEGVAREIVKPESALAARLLAGYAKYKAAEGLRGGRRELGRGRALGAHPGQGVRLVRLPDGHDEVPLRRGLTLPGCGGNPGCAAVPGRGAPPDATLLLMQLIHRCRALLRQGVRRVPIRSWINFGSR